MAHFCSWLSQMRAFAIVEKEREMAFGNLINQWLRAILPEEIKLEHQKRGKSIVDIQLFVNVGDSASYCTAPVSCPTGCAAATCWAREGLEGCTHMGHVCLVAGCKASGYRAAG